MQLLDFQQMHGIINIRKGTATIENREYIAEILARFISSGIAERSVKYAPYNKISIKIVVCLGSQFQYTPQVSFENIAPEKVARITKTSPIFKEREESESNFKFFVFRYLKLKYAPIIKAITLTHAIGI